MQPGSAAFLAAIAFATALGAQTGAVNACSRWQHCARERVEPRPPRYYRDATEDSGVRYYRANPCAYGDCPCIRGIAIRTGSRVWWDRYQACTGG